MRITNEPVYRRLFGSRLKQRILRYLYSEQAPVSEREMASILGSSHTAVNKAMKQLLEINAVGGVTVGRAWVWTLNKESFTYPLIQTFFDKLSISPLDFIKKELSEAIAGEIELINKKTDDIARQEGKQVRPHILAAFIFGSVAEGTSRKNSDIDVLVVLETDYNNEALAKRLQAGSGMRILARTGNMTSFHVYSQNAIKKNEPQWLALAVEKGIRVC
ncbi:MAG: nucleotidyltransferase domain-containing protein [Candidatus Micrarchaeota archaeon]